jgi:hypothetical protein
MPPKDSAKRSRGGGAGGELEDEQRNVRWMRSGGAEQSEEEGKSEDEIRMAAKAQAAEFKDREDALEAEKQQWELEKGQARDALEAEKQQARAEIRDREEALEAAKQQWELEKAALKQTFGQIVKLDVGGTRFKTLLSTLQRFPDTMIGAMFSGRHKLTTDSDENVFIDANGAHFQHILDFLRRPEVPIKLSGGLRTVLEAEATYFGINELMFPKEVFEYSGEKSVVKDQLGNRYVVSQDVRGIWFAVWERNVNLAACIEEGYTREKDPKFYEFFDKLPNVIKYQLEVCSNCETTAVHELADPFKSIFMKDFNGIPIEQVSDLLLKDFFKDRTFSSRQPRREIPCNYCLCASSSEE